ncbi:MAG: GtrA family protein [Bacteroidia bacterium]|nr:GtrA family protein [Bacteroidia bacterium]
MYLVTIYLNKLLKNKLILFFVVSGLNTVFGYGLFALLIFIGIIYPLALLISTIAGILFNFKTIGVVIFKNHNNILIFKFLGVYGITYLCNLGGLALFKSFEINIYLSGAILLIPVGLLAFILNKIFVFKN